jgi:rhamnosyltransferase
MISVAVATYNGEKYILQQLQSIAEQTRKADEVVISDDASKDNTVQLIYDFIKKNQLQNWRLIENKNNQGFNDNFFNALDNTHGDIIFLSDQDDVWLPNKIEIMAGLMEQDPHRMMLSSAYSVIDSNGAAINSKNVINAIESNDGSFIPVTVNSQISCSYIRGCAMCMRRQVVLAADREHLSFILGHDWILGMTASLLGENQIYHKQLFQYRFHGNNASLSAVTRKNLIGDIGKRTIGLQQSIQAHQKILNSASCFPNFTLQDQKDMEDMIHFERKRLKFLTNHNFFVWVSLFLSMKKYKRYYKSLKGAIKVYIGDFCYTYNVNFKVK